MEYGEVLSESENDLIEFIQYKSASVVTGRMKDSRLRLLEQLA